MTRVPVTFFLVGLVVGGPAAWAEEPAEPVLVEALTHEALEQNLEIQAAQMRVKAARAKVPIARAFENPRLGVEPEGMRSPVSFGTYQDIEYSLSQKWPFFGKPQLRGQSAQQEVRIAEAELEATKRRVIAQVKGLYYELYLIDQGLQIAEANRDLLTQFAKIAETKYATGQAAQPDVLKAQVELSQVHNEVITWRQRREASEAKMNAALNRPIQAPVGRPVLREASRALLGWEDLEAKTVVHRPDLAGMRWHAEKMAVERQLAKLELVPDIETIVEARQRRGGGGLDEYDFMIGVEIPFWFWSKQPHEVTRAQAEFEQARDVYEAMKRTALAEVKEQRSKVEAAQHLVQLYETSILPQAEQAVKATRAAYETAQADFLTLIDAQRTFKGFQLEHVQQQVSLEQEWAKLEQAVGVELAP